MYEKIPLLTPADVQLRVAQLQTTSYGTYATLLCYKDSRVDMKILDEIYGPLNWKKEHLMIGDNIFCTISIYDPEKKEWIPKTDVGTESNTEATKGAVSDSMKRASVLWGIGRELYQAPFIRFKLHDNEVSMGTNGKPKTYARFAVGRMTYDKEKNAFTEFTVIDAEGNVRFSLEKSEVKSVPAPKHITAPIPEPEPKQPVGVFLNSVCHDCGAEIKSQRVADFSRKRWGKPLCYSCQQRQAA